ncbi:MAG: glutathione S-transferase family protein [Neomegalonema sp.]|nr:glutathione S-transferase family protein [Neomegalonema sp.]
MKVYSRNMSPFGRRVMIWLNLQGHAFEQVPLQTTGPDFEKLKQINPQGRVPVLVLDDGSQLVESAAICDYLETLADPAKKLIPTDPAARLEAMRVIGCATLLMEKSVAYIYESSRRPEEFRWPDWAARLDGQVKGGIAELEALAPDAGFLGGDVPNGADVQCICAVDFLQTTYPQALEGAATKLMALSARANAIDVIEKTHPKHT